MSFLTLSTDTWRNRRSKKLRLLEIVICYHRPYTYSCAQCQYKEDISRDVVDFFDAMDPGDPNIPVRFRCESCGGVATYSKSRLKGAMFLTYTPTVRYHTALTRQATAQHP